MNPLNARPLRRILRARIQICRRIGKDIFAYVGGRENITRFRCCIR
ncbi:MAG: PTS transporter subunit EIIB [Elusimicrobiaceae bacterium]|nr:PTS transporter subunit EIIB [Elusimicrobiaceae bacterium]